MGRYSFESTKKSPRQILSSVTISRKLNLQDLRQKLSIMVLGRLPLASHHVEAAAVGHGFLD
jgi:hypothetical protein